MQLPECTTQNRKGTADCALYFSYPNAHESVFKGHKLRTCVVFQTGTYLSI